MKGARKNLLAALQSVSPAHRIGRAVSNTQHVRAGRSAIGHVARALRGGSYGVLGRAASHLMNPERGNRIGYVGHAAKKSRR